MASPMIYRDVFDQLEQSHIRYIVVSGAAVVLHGYERPIADLDLVIDPTPAEAKRAIWVLTACGFVANLPLPLSLVTVMRMFDRLNREVDVFMRYAIPFEEMWANSFKVPLRDSLARILSLEHLVRVKRFSNRPHDLKDIEKLLSLQNRPG